MMRNRCKNKSNPIFSIRCHSSSSSYLRSKIFYFINTMAFPFRTYYLLDSAEVLIEVLIPTLRGATQTDLL